MIRRIIACAALALVTATGTASALPLRQPIASALPSRPPIEHAQLLGSLKLDGKLFHVQGVAVDEAHIWVTSVDHATHRGYLHEFDRASGRILRRIDLTDGARYHPGGLSLTGRSLWVPVAEMRRGSSAVLDEIDIDTLTVKRRIAVKDHIGCVAASGSQLIAGNWDSRQFYMFDLYNPAAPARVIPNPSRTKFQDMKLIGSQLVAGGQLGKHGGTIDWIDWSSMTVTRSLHAGAMKRTKFLGKAKAYTAEGMALDGKELFLVPQDGPAHMFHFRLDT